MWGGGPYVVVSVGGKIDYIPKAGARQVVGGGVCGVGASKNTLKTVLFGHSVRRNPSIADRADPLQSKVLPVLEESGPNVVKVSV